MSEKTLSIAGLNKAAVLAVLYNAEKPQGMGFMHYDSTPMIVEEAQKIIDEEGLDFDYLKGRVMKISLAEDSVNPLGYDRENGEDAAERAINEVRKGTGDVNSPQIQKTHCENTRQSAADMRQHLNEESRRVGNVFQLGTAEFKEELGPKINKAIGHENQ